jgi:hypothetical protein
MPSTTSLNLQAILKTAATRTGMDSSAHRVRGLSPSAQALYVAAQVSHRRNAVTVVVVPTDEEVDRFCLDVRFFMAALEGASAASLEDAVKPFPSLQVDPYRTIAPHFGVASARAAALHGVASGRARVIAASAASLMPRLSAPGNLEAAAIELKNGMDLDPVAFGDLLADAGFTREDPVDEHGEFCVRGGIVDFFPAGADNPVRVEFVGDNIESIRRAIPPPSDRSRPWIRHPSHSGREGGHGDILRLPARRPRPVVHRARRRRGAGARREAGRAGAGGLCRGAGRTPEGAHARRAADSVVRGGREAGPGHARRSTGARDCRV